MSLGKHIIMACMVLYNFIIKNEDSNCPSLHKTPHNYVFLFTCTLPSSLKSSSDVVPTVAEFRVHSFYWVGN